MAERKTERITRRLTAEERARHTEIREQVGEEFPPAQEDKTPAGAYRDRCGFTTSRKAQGLTYYAVAKQAGIPNSNTVKDIEYGRDAKLSNIEAVAKVLGLKLELVEA